MALGKEVKRSLDEASENLRNALAYAARGENPMVCQKIGDILNAVNDIEDVDLAVDFLEDLKAKLKDLHQE
jgi:predicted DNA-binding protein